MNAAPTPAHLDMQQVSYTYPGWPPVVHQVDWNIARGEVHCLVGRSVCGKTTLLKLAAGLFQPDKGRVCVEGRPLDGPDTRTGFVFQSPTLLDWLTVLDNVLLPITLHQRPDALHRQRAQTLLAQMGLGALVQHRPRQLSGGQQSRVAIARALVTEPSILLMDEPFAALDAITREELQDDLLRMVQACGTSVFFVTHDIAEAVYLADRVAVMDAGTLREDVTVSLPRPRRQAQRYSAEFNALCARLRAAMDREAC
jgi:NitT/TauT family transport system ATP-binding protein